MQKTWSYRKKNLNSICGLFEFFQVSKSEHMHAVIYMYSKRIFQF